MSRDRELRQTPRFQLRMPVVCESPAHRDYRTLGLTQNVSQSGLLVEAAQPLPQGTSTDLRMLAGGVITRADAVVVWMADNASGRMGMQFTRMTEANSVAWERLLATQAAQGIRTSLRIPIDLEVTCVVPEGTRLRGRAENLSDGGMMVVLPQAVPPQTRVSLEIPLWLVLPAMEAQVVWMGAKAEVPDVAHGLRFLTEERGKELFLIGTLLRRFLQ
ncbi:MAG: PilZ domain-containing protein [Candidatus Methylomirabilales bacterium]